MRKTLHGADVFAAGSVPFTGLETSITMEHQLTEGIVTGSVTISGYAASDDPMFDLRSAALTIYHPDVGNFLLLDARFSFETIKNLAEVVKFKCEVKSPNPLVRCKVLTEDEPVELRAPDQVRRRTKSKGVVTIRTRKLYAFPIQRIDVVVFGDYNTRLEIGASGNVIDGPLQDTEWRMQGASDVWIGVR